MFWQPSSEMSPRCPASSCPRNWISTWLNLSNRTRHFCFPMKVLVVVVVMLLLSFCFSSRSCVKLSTTVECSQGKTQLFCTTFNSCFACDLLFGLKWMVNFQLDLEWANYLTGGATMSFKMWQRGAGADGWSVLARHLMGGQQYIVCNFVLWTCLAWTRIVPYNPEPPKTTWNHPRTT